MNPLEIILPFIWASGLLGLIALFSRPGEKFPLENLFPLAGALGLFIYLLGLFDLWSGAVFVIMTVVLALLFIWACVKTPLVRRLLDFVRSHMFFSASFAAALTWFGLAALSFPVSGDALYFHLGLPKLYAEAGKMFFTPGILFSAGPRAMEMISTGFYFLGLERGQQLFIVIIAAALILSIYLRAADFGARGIYAVLIFISVPIVITQVTASKNDFLLWGLSFFTCLKFIEFRQSGKMSCLLWSAVGVGLAAGTKAIGLGLLGALTAAILYEAVLGKNSFRHPACFLVVAIAVLSPWYIYSWVITGNPVFPFFDNIFHSPLTNPAFERFNAFLAIERISPNIINLILSPIRIIFEPELYDGRLGYALILFPFLLIFTPRIPHKLKFAIGISVVFYIIWFFGFAFARFLIPVGPLLAMAGAYFLCRAAKISKALRLATLVSLCVAALLPIPGVMRDTVPRALAVVKGTPKIEFLRGLRALDPYQTQSGEMGIAMPYIDCWRTVNENTPENSRIGILTSFVSRADGYYLDREFIYLNPSEQVQYNFTQDRDYEDISRALTRLGITHLVIDSVVAGQFAPGSDWAEIPGFEQFSGGVTALISFCRDHCEMIFSDGRYRIYKL